jgi:hypothetical protein
LVLIDFFFRRSIHDLEDLYVRKQITISRFHVLASQLFHTYTRKLPRQEGDVLAEEFVDEIDFRLSPVTVTYAGDEDFAPEEDWSDLESIGDDLEDLELEDSLNVQAEKAAEHMSQLVPQCPICLQEIVDSVITTCGHQGCYQCFFDAGLFRNVDPLPKCPCCRSVIVHIIRMFKPNMIRREDAIDAQAEREQREQADVMDADNDLDPSLPGKTNNLWHLFLNLVM